jgi:hypothetical protein
MEVRINKEVRDYQESIFFGLSIRQFIFAILAVGVAVAVYFCLKDVVGTSVAHKGNTFIHRKRTGQGGDCCDAALCIELRKA